jgi:hypothetical protein
MVGNIIIFDFTEFDKPEPKVVKKRVKKEDITETENTETNK